ncbi:aspartate aminotransferase family protein [Pelagivirga sediminicola]|uniref:Aspartate aminotransferase family protein n=1 Tax=Pelagivirga sediminicola TaxID=2170575 RepID=A0A2T7GA74_9RHOB|nr:aspartate aminotransferase family protein [Pelagivirga sediminicola]PVA11327.1 aspartate aminotransferase family protein [Pelagivirga sediminicola]
MKTGDLMARRQRALAPFHYHMFERPLHIVRGEGVWLWDADGRKYLDCYNNVPSVGHAHPRIVAAMSTQAAQLNTHTRYLHEGIVTLAERLLARLPDGIDTSAFVCTGSEANDLALQMARLFTGAEGVVVYDGAYHGNTALTLAASPSEYPPAERPEWLAVLEAPNLYRGAVLRDDPAPGQALLARAVAALDALEARGQRIGCLLLDCAWDSNGPLLAPVDYVQGLCAEIRARGGLIVCDEVQAGYCRMGAQWWGFQRYGITPDIVTCGKPMGAGHPVAAVFMRRDIAERMAAHQVYFNTFGGNPVSAAVANAVIDVIEDEGLMDNSARTGAYFLAALQELQARHPVIGDIQGVGLFHGLDMVRDAGTKAPFGRADMARLGNLIAQEGVITGTSGRHGQTLKLRPPLVFAPHDADLAVQAIDRALASFSPQEGRRA